MDQFIFLGYKFDASGITLTDERVSGILNMEPPNDLRGVQRLMGTFVYIARFIPDLQEQLLPISLLLNKKIFFQMGR